MDDHVVAFIKTWLWAPFLALLSWLWTRNERKHQEALKRSLQAQAAHSSLKEAVSTLGSGITDRMMAYIDSQVSELRAEQVKRMDQLADNDRTLFANAEKDRATFRDMLERHAERSEQRHRELVNLHIEMMGALAGKADRK